LPASRRGCIFASFALLGIALASPLAHADTLTITSTPPGATVEFEDVRGTTPYRIEYPGGYFHKTHSVFGTKLEHALVLKISKDGYVTQRITLTEGPFEWVGLTGKRHGNYWLLKTDRFDIKLEAAESWGADDTKGPLRPHDDGASSKAIGTSTLGGTGSVTIASDPPSAEIFVDGQFVGQTPATIHILTGIHRVEVKSSGKRKWERDIEILKDSQVTLHPALEKEP